MTDFEVEVSLLGLTLRGLRTEAQSLDVLFDGVRIWSFTSRPDDQEHYYWPPLLKERLFGHARVEVRDSSTGQCLGAEHLEFDTSNQSFRLLDAEGQQLVLNKWLRLAPMLVSKNGDRRDALIRNLQMIRDDLIRLGECPFAVGGTALGPYRDGDLFPHDDDGDLAVFVDSDEPVEISRHMLKLERKLRDLGYWVRAHSHAHLQVYPVSDSRDSSLYVDVFAAFLKDGMINQPFHVRGEFEREQLLPFASVRVRDEEFSIPRDSEAWFRINYGDDWHLPQPGWQIETPRSTVRRFQAWFGSFNYHRHFWELYSSESRYCDDYIRDSPDLPIFEFCSTQVLNVGCGADPFLPSSLTILNPRGVVHALDYSDSMRATAREAARAGGSHNVQIDNVNFLNYHEFMRYVGRLENEPFDIYVGFAAETQDRRRRRPVFWRLVRMALKSGGAVIIDHVTEPENPVDKKDPRTWHLEDEWVAFECSLHGLKPLRLGGGNVRIAGKSRKFSRARIVLDPSPLAVEGPEGE